MRGRGRRHKKSRATDESRKVVKCVCVGGRRETEGRKRKVRSRDGKS